MPISGIPSVPYAVLRLRLISVRLAKKNVTENKKSEDNETLFVLFNLQA